MNNANSIKKKIAFAAALVFVSYSYMGNAAVIAETSLTAETSSADDGAIDRSTFEITISNDNLLDELSFVTFEEFANKIFTNPPLSIDFANKKITVGNDNTDITKFIYYNDKLYRLNSSINGVITYSAFDKIEKLIPEYDQISADKIVSFSYDSNSFTDDKYCKIDSNIYITPNKNYLINGSEESITVTNSPDNVVSYTSGEDGSYSIIVTADGVETEYVITKKLFNIARNDDITVTKNGEESPSFNLNWTDISQYTVSVSNADSYQAFYVSDGTSSKIYPATDGTLNLEELIRNDSLITYSDGITYTITPVVKYVKPVVYVDGVETATDIESFFVKQQGNRIEYEAGRYYYFEIPYLYNDEYYLEGYEYGGTGELDASEVFSALESGNKNYSHDYNIGENSIVLRYKKAEGDKNFRYYPRKDIVRRSQYCYTVESLSPNTQLFEFSPESESKLLVFETMSTSKGYPAISKNFYSINDADKKNFIVTWSQYNNPNYLIAKNLLNYDQYNEKITNYLDNSICFYRDTTPPVITMKSESSNSWANSHGTSFSINITDFEESPVANKSELTSDVDKEIQRVYDEYINYQSPELSEISTIYVGNYRFDKSTRGWTSSQLGRYESDALRTARENLVSQICAVTPNRLDSSLVNSRQQAEDLVNDIPALEECLRNPSDNNISWSEINALQNRLYQYKIADNTNPLDYSISLSYNQNTRNINFYVSVNEGVTNKVIEDNLKIVAYDNSYNKSNICTQQIHIDTSAPEIAENKIEISNAYPVKNSDGDYVVHAGTEILVAVNEEGSGIKKVLCGLNAENNPAIEMTNRGNGVYGYTLTEEDLAGQNYKATVTVKVVDNAGNESDKIVAPFRIIADSLAPNGSLAEISSPKYINTSAEPQQRWYGSYSEIKYKISAQDIESDVCSGIKNVVLTVNGNANDFKVGADGLNPTDLAAGNYYLTFETLNNYGAFRAVLRNSNSSSFAHTLYENYDSSDGSVNVDFIAYDYSENASVSNHATVYVDEHTPKISSVVADNKGILSNVSSLNYSLFSKGEVEIIIKAEDIAPSAGISAIDVTLKNPDGSDYQNHHFDLAYGGADSCSVKIPLNFKGYICTNATDNMGNISDTVTTVGIVTENGYMHTQTSSASIDIPSTPFRDIDGLPLYRDDINASISIGDHFSAISKVSLEASGHNNKVITAQPDGTLDGDDADKWYIHRNAGDHNLIPEISRDITVSQNSNGNRIAVNVTDNADSVDGGSRSEVEFSIDKTNPVIKVEYIDPENSASKKIFGQPRKAVVTVNERNFSPDLTKVLVNGTRQNVSWYLADGVEGTDSAVYRTDLLFDKDGKYTLSVESTDLCEREAEKYKGDEFIIDLTAPVLKPAEGLSSEPDKGYTGSVNASFSFVDDNFDPSNIKISGTLDNKPDAFPKNSGWVTNGNTHTTVIKFDKDGEYTINISGKDSAGNEIDPYNNKFYIDTEKPVIDLKNVSKANNGETISPLLIFNDRHLDKSSISIRVDGAKQGSDLSLAGELIKTKDGYEYKFANIPNSEKYDDIYTVYTSVSDTAGNTTKDIFQFSVNRYGSTFMLDDTTESVSGSYISEGKDLVIKELNVDKHSGSYSVIVSKDGKTSELTDREDYKVVYTVGEQNWSEYEYIIPARNFIDEAEYTVSIHSVDKAGNVNVSDSIGKKAELTFYIDKTKPVCVKNNLASNTAYKAKNYPAEMEVFDNVKLKDVQVYIDGKLTPSRLNDGIFSFNIKNSNRAQDVKVVLTDMADNREEYVFKNILVTTNFLRYIIHQTWFKIVSGGLLAGLLGLIGAVIFKKKRFNPNRYD
ncbi:MAG: Ig-like domain-containing protein [Ruminococcus sp.]|nr:Ig-like domain-containing protein [Ruminococcus sp.]